MAESEIRIGARRVGDGQPCFIIAEAGVNHNGDLALAERLVDAAADAGADAVKFQTFDPDLLASADAQKAGYQKETTGADGDQRTMLHALALPTSAWGQLQARARTRGLLWLSTPFDARSAEILDEIGVPAFKLSSGEVTNHLLLEHVGGLAARNGKPVLLSTGMANLSEVHDALTVLHQSGNPPVALFHCVSSYPADPQDCNLRAMATMRDAFGVPLGFSNHSLGIDVALAAAALGAALIEKHLTLDCRMPGPDHRASLEPQEMKRLVAGVRRVEQALGDGTKAPRPSEVDVARVARRSLYWRVSLPRGTSVQRDHVVALRPGTGRSATRLQQLWGVCCARDVLAGAPVVDEDLP